MPTEASRKVEVLPAEDVDDDLTEEAPEPDEVTSLAPIEPPSSHDLEVHTSGLAPFDPFRRYLEEIQRYPLLTQEEEIELTTRLKETGDLEAAKRLVQSNLRLVIKIAFEYRSLHTQLMDLIQEGNIGLMKAVSKYDPAKGARLGYYASWWIRSYILKYLLDQFRLVKIGTTQAQKKLFYQLMREKERLEAQGLLAGPKLLAESLNVREKDVIEMQHRLSGAGAELSLESRIQPGNEDSPTLLEKMASPDASIEDVLGHQEQLEILMKQLPAFEKTLSEKERRLLKDRLLSDEPKTLQEVAEHYGLTRERARQIEAKVIAKLKDFLKSSLR